MDRWKGGWEEGGERDKGVGAGVWEERAQESRSKRESERASDRENVDRAREKASE